MELGRSSAALAAALLFASAPSGAMAQDLVANGGFETGNFAGWTQSGNTNLVSVGAAPHSGTYAAVLGNGTPDGYLSQNLATTIGDTYTVSFWLWQIGGSVNHFSASFGGTSLLSLSNASPFGWTEYSYTVTASATTSPLVFGFMNNPAAWALDDISVMDNPAPAPVPGSGLLSLAFFALIGFGSFARRSRTFGFGQG